MTLSIFGEEVAELVAALTEDSDISHYAQRKRAPRASIIAAGSSVVDVAIADKIASLRGRLHAHTGTVSVETAFVLLVVGGDRDSRHAQRADHPSLPREARGRLRQRVSGRDRIVCRRDRQPADCQ